MAEIDTFTKTDIAGNVITVDLQKSSEGKWSVTCWQGPSADDQEFHWQVFGVVTGYVDGNPNRPITTPFTEETARAEFERWR